MTDRLATLGEQLRRADELARGLVGVLDGFEARLEGLQQAVAPAHSATKRLTTVSLNVEMAHGQLARVVAFFDEMDVLRPQILTASIAADVPAYLALLARVTDVLLFLFRFKLRQTERVYVALRTMHKAGVERLQGEFANLLERAAVSLETAVGSLQDALHARTRAPAESPASAEPTPVSPSAGPQLLIDAALLPTLEQLASYLLGVEDVLKQLGPIAGTETKSGMAVLSVPAFMSENSTASHRTIDSMASGGSDGVGLASVSAASMPSVGGGPFVTFTYDSGTAVALAHARAAFVVRLLPLVWSACTSESASATAALSASGGTPTRRHGTFSVGRKRERDSVLAGSLNRSRSFIASDKRHSIGSLGSASNVSIGGGDSTVSVAASRVRQAMDDRVDITSYAAVAYERGSHPMIAYAQMVAALLEAERSLADRLFGAGAAAAKAVCEALMGPVMHDIVGKGDVILMRAKRAVAHHDFSELLVLFDLVSSLGAHFEALESFALYCGKMSSDVNEIMAALKAAATTALAEFVDDMQRPLRQSTLPPDGNVHELTSNTVDFLQRMEEYRATCDQLLAVLPGMLPGDGAAAQGRPTTAFGAFTVRVLEALGRTLETQARKVYKAKALEAIFLLNNNHYMLKHLRAPRIAAQVGTAALAQFGEHVSLHADDYHTSWKEVVQYLLEVNAGRSLIQGLGMDKHKVKDRFKGFNTEFEALYEAQQAFSIPDADLRQQIRQTVIGMVVPLYTKFLERYANSGFTSNPAKYIKLTAEELEQRLSRFFDTAA